MITPHTFMRVGIRIVGIYFAAQSLFGLASTFFYIGGSKEQLRISVIGVAFGVALVLLAPPIAGRLEPKSDAE